VGGISKVKVIRCHEYGTPDVLRIDEVPPRDPGPGEIRVRLNACGINFPDILLCAGTYQNKPDFPFSPGLEAAGEIIDRGAGVTEFDIGDRVMLWCGPDYDGYAEEVTLPVERAFAVPAGMDDIAAARQGSCWSTAPPGMAWLIAGTCRPARPSPFTAPQAASAWRRYSSPRRWARP
jgi:NADPH2:quinone reductase